MSESRTVTGERTIVLVRLLHAPRELVFDAWTDPKKLAQWFGPRMFYCPDCEVDARPGGTWRLIMAGPNEFSTPVTGVYTEVVRPEKLAFTNNAVAKDGTVMLQGDCTVTFEDVDGNTRMTLEARMVGYVAEAPQMLAGMDIGWSQSFDKMEEFLAG